MRRRDWLKTTLTALAMTPLSAFAALTPTPRQSRGPFYPDRIPLDKDNDLVLIEGSDRLADGEITHLAGQILDRDGEPVEGALVEIWQCDAHGRYLHSRDPSPNTRDPDFQGYGRYTTGADGGYRFRTIKPVPYPGRAPHIHFAVRAPGRDPFVTQMYVEGAPENARDGLLSRVDPTVRSSLIVPFRQSDEPGATLAARFNLVLS
jgi:protocatechuate 3,4-dioxygenase, beta subunit